MDDLNVVNDVIVSGNGFSCGVSFGTLQAAQSLASELYQLRNQSYDLAFPLFDDDSHLSGWVVPCQINSVIIQGRLIHPYDLNQVHYEMVKAQTEFYKSHTNKPD